MWEEGNGLDQVFAFQNTKVFHAFPIYLGFTFTSLKLFTLFHQNNRIFINISGVPDARS